VWMRLLGGRGFSNRVASSIWGVLVGTSRFVSNSRWFVAVYREDAGVWVAEWFRAWLSAVGFGAEACWVAGGRRRATPHLPRKAVHFGGSRPGGGCWCVTRWGGQL